MTDDLHKRVLGWLRDTGYPLELRVGRRLQAAGWHVNYSRWYRDTSSSKDRELDVEALVAGIHKNEASVFFSLCLECKTSKQKPWVGLSSGQTIGSGSLLSFAIGSLTRLTLIAAHAEKLTVPDVVPPTTPRVGGLVQAFGAKDDNAPSPPHTALLQARSAALALDRAYKATALDVAERLSTAAVFLPMVVVHGQLLEYVVDAELNERVRSVEALVASVPGGPEGEAALVPVVTEQFAEQMAASYYPSAHGFCVAMLAHVSTITNALRIRALEPADE